MYDAYTALVAALCFFIFIHYKKQDHLIAQYGLVDFQAA